MIKKLFLKKISMVWFFLLIVLAAIFFWGFVTSNLILKIPRLPLDANPKTFGHEYESFKIVTEDGVEIEGWFVPAKLKSEKTIVVLHGWGANRSDVLPSTIFLSSDYNMVYFDFRNHGRSGGNSTSLTCLEVKDFLSVVRYLKSEKREISKIIGVFGFSMGGSVAITGSSQVPEIKAVIAESPFSSFNRTVIRFAKLFYGIPSVFVPPTLIATRIRLGFNPEKCSPIYWVDKLSPRPLLLIQGEADQRMPVIEGQSLYDRAGEPKEIWIVPGADHGTIREDQTEQYQSRISQFFRKYL